MVAASTGSSVQLRHPIDGRCVASSPPPAPVTPPVANLFRDARVEPNTLTEILLVTSTSTPVANGTMVDVVLRCPQRGDDPSVERPLFCAPSTEPKSTIGSVDDRPATLTLTMAHPGDATWRPVPPSAITRLPDQSLELTLPVVRGAVVVRLRATASAPL